MTKKMTIDGVELNLSEPIDLKQEWVGQEDVLQQILACWMILDESDVPLCPRIVGKPGIGKTTLAVTAAQKMKQDVYIFQCTMDTRPEDLLVTPVLRESGEIQYQASSVVSAMINGGICILDEGNRMSEKSWASLAPLLDQRRYVDSIVSGIRIKAHPDFRACVTMNDDASTYELPDYILSRLQPNIEILFPPKEEELTILKYNVPFAEEKILDLTVDFLQKAHNLELNVSTRDGIHILRYYLKRSKQTQGDSKELFEEAIRRIVGEDALHLDELQKKQLNRQKRERYQQDLDEMFSNPFLAELFGGASPLPEDAEIEIEYEDDEDDDDEDDLEDEL